MQWEDGVDAGAWIRDRLDAGYDTMHGVVPRGFEAYARVLHPAEVRSMRGSTVPTDDEWRAFSPDELERVSAAIVDEPATWAEAAAAFGTALHPLAQWNRIVGAAPGEDWQRRRTADGREFSAPLDGELSPADLARLAAHLVPATTTPDAGFAAVWAGYGGLTGGYGTTGRGFFGFGAPEDDPAAQAHAQMLARSIHDPFNNVFLKPEWQDGILPREVSEGPHLELPGREYVLFSAPPRAFADPSWILDAPWRDLPAEEHGFPPSAQHPNLLWPADRAWVMVSEIDFDSTVVAGSAELVAAICADPALEVHPIPEGAALTWDGDGANP